jgi:thiamine pyrophosphate-dependent acetolactate synthase large subunit-like protein
LSRWARRLGFNSTFYSYDNINRDAAIIQIELDPAAIGRHFPVSVGIWADAPTVARQLAEAVGKMQQEAEVDQWCETYKAERTGVSRQARCGRADGASDPAVGPVQGAARRYAEG